ncbi:MAG: formylglycine-generating enzyme family protein [Pseudomonadota bacterium]
MSLTANATKRPFIMVRIPAGDFIMGSPPGHGHQDEFPPHSIFLEEYLIGRGPATAAEFSIFLNQVGNPRDEYLELDDQGAIIRKGKLYRPRQGLADYPANGVTWFGAKAFCAWLSEKTGKRYDLPTEAQWEKAARGDQEGRRYPWGNNSPRGMAQFQQVWANPKLTLSPVGAYPPNGYGLFDMAGNVWEWCADWYDRNYYRESPRENPRGPAMGETKVLRGGSWGAIDVQVRCGIRLGERPDISDSGIGFRLAREP